VKHEPGRARDRRRRRSRCICGARTCVRKVGTRADGSGPGPLQMGGVCPRWPVFPGDRRCNESCTNRCSPSGSARA
jgi:hypothetical protein